MSRWNWLGVVMLTGILLTLGGCRGKETPQPQANNGDQAAVAVASEAKRSDPVRHAAPIAKRPVQDQQDAAAKMPDEPSVKGPNPSQPVQDSNIAGNSGPGQVGIATEKQYLEKRLSELKTLVRSTKVQRAITESGKGDPKKLVRDQTDNLAKRLEGVGDGKGKDGMGDAAGAGEPRPNSTDGDTENYERIVDNPYILVKTDPLSTISSAVDTASYSNIRARLNAGQLPPKDAVRIADMLNYFNYEYAGPKNDDPVAFSLEIAPCAWQPKHHLLRIGLKAKTIDKDKMPPRNLTFLIDTSGSMNLPNRLPLVKQSLRLLVVQLTDKDMVSIVTYAGNAGVALPPTPGSEKDTILKMIESFNAGGSTNGEGGLRVAYDQATAGFIKEGVNRVILATDGDFNVGVSSDAELVRLIEAKRATGVYLTVLGYGMGNLKDSKLEQLAHHGNGHYAYIDTLDEAKKVFVEQGGSLVMVAKDVKLQVEFNPLKVAGYRLIGYENRILRHEDFRDDQKDAGDMGSGLTCTALYEIVPVGEKVAAGDVEPLKYQTAPKLSDAAKSGEWATVRMRYKHPDTDKAKEVEAPLKADAMGQKVTNDFEFAANVAAFGMLLRDSEFKGIATYQALLETVEGLLRDKKDPHREEFAKLMRVALTIEQAKQK